MTHLGKNSTLADAIRGEGDQCRQNEGDDAFGNECSLANWEAQRETSQQAVEKGIRQAVGEYQRARND